MLFSTVPQPPEQRKVPKYSKPAYHLVHTTKRPVNHISGLQAAFKHGELMGIESPHKPNGCG